MLERGRRMLSEEFFSAEQRDPIIFYGKKVGLVYLLVRLHNHESTLHFNLIQVMIECQKHDSYQEAIHWFVDHLKQYTNESHCGVTRSAGQNA